MHRLALATALALIACHHPSPGAATVATLTGVWAGMAEGTPLGNVPFALAFDRDADGSIHARTDDGRGSYLDFRFVQRTGAWVLVEEGAIPGVGKQTHTLAPADATHWRDQEVDVALDVSRDALVMTTTIRGKPHATFRLQRKQGAEGEQIRAQLAKLASHTARAE